MSYQIVNPIDTDWKTFDNILKQIQKETRIICNKTINLLMDLRTKKKTLNLSQVYIPKSKKSIIALKLQ
jgi:hypothetical protein